MKRRRTGRPTLQADMDRIVGQVRRLVRTLQGVERRVAALEHLLAVPKDAVSAATNPYFGAGGTRYDGGR